MNWYFSSGIPGRSEGVFIEPQTLVCVPTQKAAALSLDKVVVVATLTCYFQIFLKRFAHSFVLKLYLKLGLRSPMRLY